MLKGLYIETLYIEGWPDIKCPTWRHHYMETLSVFLCHTVHQKVVITSTGATSGVITLMCWLYYRLWILTQRMSAFDSHLPMVSQQLLQTALISTVLFSLGISIYLLPPRTWMVDESYCYLHLNLIRRCLWKHFISVDLFRKNIMIWPYENTQPPHLTQYKCRWQGMCEFPRIKPWQYRSRIYSINLWHGLFWGFCFVWYYCHYLYCYCYCCCYYYYHYCYCYYHSCFSYDKIYFCYAFR